MAARVEDYALLGDCRTAALVARTGSVDWLCFPRFDSGACFAALLGTPEHGCWSIAPAAGAANTRRSYRGETLILETDFETHEGCVRLIDWMSLDSKLPRLCRLVRGIRGEVAMTLQLIIRFDYGSIVPWVQRTDHGLRAVAGPDTIQLHTTAPLHGENLHTRGDFVVRAGEDVGFELAWSGTYEPLPERADLLEDLRSTESRWKEWAHRCQYKGPWREAVVRSMITLKALTYQPTGGIVAAATTSLPEKLGGVRNWDYRYCWLRDSTFTLYSLINAGYTEEARAWRAWLVNSIAGSPADLHIMYGLSGERRLTELELGWLPGYEGSRPVRIGNAACEQHQLDVYGEVVDTLHLARRVGLEPNEDAWRIECAMLRFLERDWAKPDMGIWEMRGPPRQFTHSKVMAWVAFDRAIKSVERFALAGPVERWRGIAAEIHRDVCENGFDAQLGSFVQYYGGKALDASLLMLPLVGFLPPQDRRLGGTLAAIERDLLSDGLVDRYRTRQEVDALPEGEGAFLAATFWYADNLALQGRYDEARSRFERLLGLRNDVGLLSEEYDRQAQRLIGNFPQAFSHVGLVNTAMNLASALGPAEDRRHP